MTDTTVIMGSGDTDVKDTCPVCGGKVRGRPCSVTQSSHSVYLQVFEAEKMTGKYGIYHQAG